MRMSTSVIALRSKNDPEYKKMFKIKRLCEAEKISLPKEVDAYLAFQ